MSFVSSLFSGSKGAGYQATAAEQQQPTTSAQANTAYDQSQAGLSLQQGLLAQLQAQNGIGNQSSVYNQLQGVASGQGPNPAQAQLNQATAQNIAQQGAMMGSQRGSSANVGLLGRQIAMQGANTQQQAAGQAATLEANQRLAAMGQLGNIANSQVTNQMGAVHGYNDAAHTNQQNILNAIQGQNNSNVGMQSNINTSNAHIAAGNASGQQGMLGGLMNGAGALPGLLKGLGGGSGPTNGIPGQAMPTGGDASNGAGSLDGAGAAPIGNVAFRGGRIAPKMAAGGTVGPSSSYAQSLNGNVAVSNSFLPNPAGQDPDQSAPASSGKGGAGIGSLMGAGVGAAIPLAGTIGGGVLDVLKGAGSGIVNGITGAGGWIGDRFHGGGDKPSGTDSGSPTATGYGTETHDSFGVPRDGSASAGGPMNQGGKIPVIVSPGEAIIPRDKVKEVGTGRLPLNAAAQMIPGKAKVQGDSLKNDTVPVEREAGDVVIPRSVMNSKDPAKNAAKFVAQYMARGGLVGKQSKKKAK